MFIEGEDEQQDDDCYAEGGGGYPCKRWGTSNLLSKKNILTLAARMTTQRTDTIANEK